MNGKGGWAGGRAFETRPPPLLRSAYGGSLDPQTFIPYRVGGARVMLRGDLAFKGVYKYTFGPSQALADTRSGKWGEHRFNQECFRECPEAQCAFHGSMSR